ncbi:HAMP domain-containing histidine kinase [Paenibacillus glycanilyticus]|uniref:sensor histidine kinase n=1 Tax=Paenibacillus glycanilyticus TaxID=126569 RepID=UPI00203C3D04|nr:sensor histidine kinase [Paenibacillus glycanilyticus]MCM3630919.1 HAMP domain-containing histidine kinase [Paenibacillus glycanilyticus]
MKAVLKYVLFVLLFIAVTTSLRPTITFANTEKAAPEIRITEWQIHPGTDEDSKTPPAAGWITVKEDEAAPELPEGTSSLWVKVELPIIAEPHAGMLVEKAYAQNVSVYMDGRNLYETTRDHSYDVNRFVIPLAEASDETLYIHLVNDTGNIGVSGGLVLGDYAKLYRTTLVKQIDNIILGAAFIFIAALMFICMIFLKKVHVQGWKSLSLIIFSIGCMLIFYSPFLYMLNEDYGWLYATGFDLSSNLFLPALFFFLETFFGRGKFSIIRIFKIYALCLMIFSTIGLFLNILTNNSFYSTYYSISTILFVLGVVGGCLILLGVLLVFSFKKQKDAMILATGLGLFIIFTVADIIQYYSLSRNYEFMYWKWGIVCFVFTLVVLLGRQIVINFEKVVTYSRQLEIYNNELQRSEKMDMISQLAASVAHEVRNPLQVTRGFLQLLEEKSISNKEKNYMVLAINELDRASEIITDFLTFAKPQLEHVTVLNIANEFKHIGTILIPLANLQGGRIKLNIPDHLQIQGNSSKFKQAFINMIKNSIEALNGDGEIEINGYHEEDRVIICIKDNGVGMTESELAQLGEPYYSNKTKGTGLGLMVTFSIIEVMQGNIKFKSSKGIGTEVVITFPAG